MTIPTQLERVGSQHGSDMDMQFPASTSEYGSDISFEDYDEIALLASTLETIKDGTSTAKSAILPSIEFEEGEREDEEHDGVGVVQIHRPVGLRVAAGKGRSNGFTDSEGLAQSTPVRQREALEVEYDERSRRAWSVPIEAPESSHVAGGITSPMDKGDKVKDNQHRPPLERFRTKPQKPLSVTDLVSPSWCELQYLYTLSKFGRKPRTQAMRTGSKIHQKLEDQVHSTIPVQVQTKEDRFGLRLWNVISGLRCLRETGLTRELEIWGVVEGQIVNGIIDELSHKCPDPHLEEQTRRAGSEKDAGIIAVSSPIQPSIPQAFAQATDQRDTPAWCTISDPNLQIYITDVKIRSVQSIPSEVSLRPTWMQLMLYRKMLESLTLNRVNAETIFARYSVQPLEPFTQVFLSEVGGIGPDQEAADYPNLLSLWSLLITEMQMAIPAACLSPVLRAEFRYAKTGDVIGNKSTVYDSKAIDGYITEEMAWWKGTRAAKGVDVNEAFKCRICDFAEGCSWRMTKIEEATEKSRLRRQAREKSTV